MISASWLWCPHWPLLWPLWGATMEGKEKGQHSLCYNMAHNLWCTPMSIQVVSRIWIQMNNYLGYQRRHKGDHGVFKYLQSKRINWVRNWSPRLLNDQSKSLIKHDVSMKYNDPKTASDGVAWSFTLFYKYNLCLQQFSNMRGKVW